ncbi:MAG TPA: manganese catalase [Sporomusaceae bacterium]|jgi:bacterioferritin|uniref:ferritin-like domain-containing protein n=1 Tax=Anaerospora sp. TaxID=1960278 RepID=UPI000EE7FAE4|nr:ferritin-like domain-containing protein [Anaerospora sp.]HAK73436.1 manganese catalase [Sporomusaceae bacterium]
MKDESSDHSHSKQLYALSEPYPEVQVSGENLHYAALLLQDYAGMAGELTAINQYIYHYISLQHTYPAIADAARHIAIIEMHHFEMLGKTIELLGKAPVVHFPDYGGMRFWSSKFVYYGGNIYDKLTCNIQHEADAIRSYRNRLRQIADPCIRAVLERIILDEELHFHVFSKLRDELR